MPSDDSESETPHRTAYALDEDEVYRIVTYDGEMIMELTDSQRDDLIRKLGGEVIDA